VKRKRKYHLLFTRLKATPDELYPLIPMGNHNRIGVPFP